MNLSKELKAAGVVLVTQEVLNNIMRQNLETFNEDQRKGFMTLERAAELLTIDKRSLQNHLRDPECLIRKSKIKGRVLAESVYQEIQRLTL